MKDKHNLVNRNRLPMQRGVAPTRFAGDRTVAVVYGGGSATKSSLNAGAALAAAKRSAMLIFPVLNPPVPAELGEEVDKRREERSRFFGGDLDGASLPSRLDSRATQRGVSTHQSEILVEP